MHVGTNSISLMPSPPSLVGLCRTRVCRYGWQGRVCREGTGLLHHCCGGRELHVPTLLERCPNDARNAASTRSVSGPKQSFFSPGGLFMNRAMLLVVTVAFGFLVSQSLRAGDEKKDKDKVHDVGKGLSIKGKLSADVKNV